LFNFLYNREVYGEQFFIKCVSVSSNVFLHSVTVRTGNERDLWPVRGV